MQQYPLLQTKLYIPPIRPELVSRPRLIERLNAGLHRKLTLVSAPAGFGKTTLVTQWLKSAQCPSAWLSLDESDNDAARFLVYFVAALRTIEPRQESVGSIGKGALSALQSPQPPPVEAVLTSLINDVTALPERIVLVLDDYHVIGAKAVDRALTFLLEHLPPQMHLVIATREDPNLPLARLRVRDQVTELRVTDLRFTPFEAAEFFNQVMGLNLSVEEVASLEARTEGWIAGLHLAALSMQGREDVSGFIRAFAGDNRYIVDYLVEEVLQRQPERVRSFLLQTSILERLCGPLCDAVRFGKAEPPNSSDGSAVTGQEDGKGMLEALERGNLFVVPLDDKRHWYRYHHLFADVLKTHLMEEHPDQVPTLHRRASEWYEQNGLASDAFRHALAAEDFGRAADVAELAWQAMDGSFQSAVWLGWVGKLPDELIRTRPVLSTQYAWALWMGGELEASEARLQDAERWLEPTGNMSARPEGSADGMIVVDEEQFRTLPASIALVRAYNAEAQGDVSATARYAELALKLTPEEDLLGRAQATVSLGFTYWVSGDLEAAHQALADWIDSMQKVGSIVFAIASTYAFADIMVAQGRLQEAARAYKQSLQLASEQDKDVERVTAHLYLGLAMLYHEMDDQEAAAQHLLKSRELGEQSTLPDWPYRWSVAQAQMKESEGDLEAAVDLLDEAKRLYVRSSLPDIRPTEALKARVYVRQGRLPKAQAWAHERGLSVDDELSYLREFEHIILARVLIAEYESNRAEGSVLQAIGLLERLLNAAEEGRRMGSVIEILVLQALAHQAQGNIPLALVTLERALTLAEPEGYVRIFVDEGLPMAQLLSEAAAHGIMPDYTGKLLAASRAGERRSKGKSRLLTSPSPQPLTEPLSQRELEVLRMLNTELSGPEIARELVIALSTVRTHTKSIYSKLNVNSRWAAVKRAVELDLI
jgi:LuxR family maltose regulon positive regulatory protein